MIQSRTIWTTAFLSAVLVCALFLLEGLSPNLRLIDLKGRDVFFRLKHDWSSPPAETDQITLVVLDDETLAELETRWPYPRTLYAQALEQLKPFTPKAIGFDLIFSGNDFTAGSDSALAKAVQDAGNVVIASHRSTAGEIGPLPLIRESAWKVGIVDKPRDKDRMIRRAFRSLRVGEETIRSWEIEIFTKAFSGARLSDFPASSEIVIDYRLQFKEFRQVPFWKLLDGRVLAKDLKGKIVLVGLTAQAFHDIHGTPLGTMPGLAVNANVLLTAMTRSFFSFAPGWAKLALAWLTLWFAMLAAFSGTVVIGVIAIVLIILLCLAASFILFSGKVILDLWLVLLGMVLTYVAAILFRQGQLFLENLKLQEESSRDPLTGFYNRRFLGLKLKSELNQLAQKGDWIKSDRSIAIVMLDLDNFKLVNDSFGHAEGDRVLRTMAEAIRASVRKEELICRFGGDEFCVILPNTAIEDAAKFGEKIRSLIANNSDLVYRTANGVDTVRVTASVGVASVLGTKVLDPAKLMKAADRALYRAKTAGRNQVAVFDPARDVIE